MDLPKAVHKVRSRGKEYFYYQAGRGTAQAGPRIRLPDDPHTPQFWIAIRQAQGLDSGPRADTVNALIDAYVASPAYLTKISAGTRYQYERLLEIARKAWGELPAAGLRPAHVQAMMDSLASTPRKANNFLGVMRVLSSFGRRRDLIDQSLTEGVERYSVDSGHKPWTPKQIEAAREKLTGMVRRGIMLYLYTGQRGSDVVRLGWTDIDEGGFSLKQRKTGRDVWCPIVPELQQEMSTWEKRPGPFLRQKSGAPYDRRLFWKHFDEQRANIPELEGVTLHGLRATAVVRLRREGLTTLQISDITGMSLQMIERYCRFADKKASGKAALISLSERGKNEIVKH